MGRGVGEKVGICLCIDMYWKFWLLGFYVFGIFGVEWVVFVYCWGDLIGYLYINLFDWFV